MYYDLGVRFASPFAVEFAGDTGTVHGKQALADYWCNALTHLPDQRFRSISFVPGVDSIGLVYESVRDLYAVETTIFGDNDLVREAHCHYRTQ